eukprot:TRINITY_DN15260_c0_g1_i1.p1 TRINITY_DN15260_c0_g1~~TRINITY_DN15260_c0_g1_i1.p1  ORF type:complete len:507 (-),score=111.29 TRINITY_DN15260_c0_g1_i1:28-1437(-)
MGDAFDEVVSEELMRAVLESKYNYAHNLFSFNFHSVTPSESCAVLMGSLLAVNNTLQQMTLSDVRWSQKMWNLFFRALKSNRCLRILDLSSNLLSKGAIAELVANLQYNSTLEVLDFSACELDDDAGKSVAWLLAQPSCGLIRLTFALNLINAPILKDFAQAFQVNTKLRSFSITVVDEDGISSSTSEDCEFWDSVKPNFSLQRLYLSLGEVWKKPDEICHSALRFISGFRDLRELELLRGYGAQMPFSKMTSGLSSRLQTLSLAGISIEPEEMSMLCGELIPHLSTLELHSIQFTFPMCKMLADALQGNSTLERLSLLNSFGVDPDMIFMISAWLAQPECELVELDLRYCSLSLSAFSPLFEVLSQNKSLALLWIDQTTEQNSERVPDLPSGNTSLIAFDGVNRQGFEDVLRNRLVSKEDEARLLLAYTVSKQHGIDVGVLSLMFQYLLCWKELLKIRPFDRCDLTMM